MRSPLLGETDRRLETQAATWDGFVEATPGGDLVQTSAWGRSKRAIGLGTCLVVVRDQGGEIAGGALIVLFGLYIAGVLRIGLFGRSQQLHIQSKPAGLIGSFAVGLTFAIGWTPCVGPILGSILTLASSDRTVGQGTALLLAYSAGLGIPFLLFSLALGSFLAFFKRYRPFIPVVERVAGLLLVAVGVLVVTNYYIVLNSWALSLTPEWLLKRL